MGKFVRFQLPRKMWTGAGPLVPRDGGGLVVAHEERSGGREEDLSAGDVDVVIRDAPRDAAFPLGEQLLLLAGLLAQRWKGLKRTKKTS